MPKSKAELMRETRQRRKSAGLVDFRVWVTPEQKEMILELLRMSDKDA
jgi:hypothetical protein